MSGFSLTCAQLQTKFPQLFSMITGDPTTHINFVDAPSSARPTSLVFVIREDALTESLSCAASALVISAKMHARLSTENHHSKAILISPNVELALAIVTRELLQATPYRDEISSSSLPRIHPTAVVDPLAEVHATAKIGPYAIVQAYAKVAANTQIGSHCVLEAHALIGAETTLHPFVYIGHHCEVGDRCEIHAHSVIGKEGFGYAHDEKGNHFRIPHRGKVILENDVHVGSHCAFDRGTFGETRIGNMAKIDNLVHLAHNCKIGGHSLLTAGFMMAGSSSVGRFFVAGGRANVTGHIQICDHVQISGLSGATKDITEPGQYGGFPLQPLQESIKTRAALTHVHEMRKQLRELMKAVFPDRNPISESKKARE